MTLKDVLQAAAMSVVIVPVCIFAFDLPVGSGSKPSVESNLSLTELLATQVAEDQQLINDAKLKEREERKKNGRS